MPKDLLSQIERLEELFTVPKEKLIAITDHFVAELTKGLSKEGGSIVSVLNIEPGTPALTNPSSP